MGGKTKTCDEQKKAGNEDPCLSAIQTDVTWLKQGLQGLIANNNTDHGKIIEQARATNGSVAKIKIWQERANGAIVVMTALGVINWLGKYIISFLEK